MQQLYLLGLLILSLVWQKVPWLFPDVLMIYMLKFLHCCLAFLLHLCFTWSGDMKSVGPPIANNCSSSTESTAMARTAGEMNEAVKHAPPLRGVCWFLYFVFLNRLKLILDHSLCVCKPSPIMSIFSHCLKHGHLIHHFVSFEVDIFHYSWSRDIVSLPLLAMRCRVDMRTVLMWLYLLGDAFCLITYCYLEVMLDV